VAEEEAEAVDFHRMLLVAGLVAAAARLKILGVANNIKEKKKTTSGIFNKRSQRDRNNFLFDMVPFLLGYGWGA
jgi:hypothetical protein